MASSKGHHTSVSASLGAHHYIPDNHQDAEHNNIRKEFIPPGNGNRSPVLNLERKLVHRDLFNSDSLPVGFHLTDCIEEILTDCCLKIIASFREIGIGNSGFSAFENTDQGIAADRNTSDIVFTDLIQQFRIFNSSVDGLSEPAVENDCNHQQRAQQDNVSDYAL